MINNFYFQCIKNSSIFLYISVILFFTIFCEDVSKQMKEADPQVDSTILSNKGYSLTPQNKAELHMYGYNNRDKSTRY